MEDVFGVEESQQFRCFLCFRGQALSYKSNQSVINKSFGEPFEHFMSHYDDKGKQTGRCKTLD